MPGDRVHPEVVDVMREIGIDIAHRVDRCQQCRVWIIVCRRVRYRAQMGVADLQDGCHIST